MGIAYLMQDAEKMGNCSKEVMVAFFSETFGFFCLFVCLFVVLVFFFFFFFFFLRRNHFFHGKNKTNTKN